MTKNRLKYTREKRLAWPFHLIFKLGETDLNKNLPLEINIKPELLRAN